MIKNLFKLNLILILILLMVNLTYAVDKSDLKPPAGKELKTAEEISEQQIESKGKIESQGIDQKSSRSQTDSMDIQQRKDQKSIGEISEQGIAVRPPRPYPIYNLGISVWTDKYTYYVGEKIRIYFRVNRPAYVYIYNTNAAGVTRQLFPNYYDRDNYIQPGWTYFIPDRSYSLTITPPSGRETIHAVAIMERYPFLRGYIEFNSSDPFPRFQGGGKALIEKLNSEPLDPSEEKTIKSQDIEESGVKVSGKLGISVHPKHPRRIYAEDWTRIEVIDDYYDDDYYYDDYSRFGYLRIRTDPREASIRIDGEYMGKSPKGFVLPAGVYRVTISKKNYITWSSMVRVRPNFATRIYVDLRRDRGFDYGPGYNFERNIQNEPLTNEEKKEIKAKSSKERDSSATRRSIRNPAPNKFDSDDEESMQNKDSNE